MVLYISEVLLEIIWVGVKFGAGPVSRTREEVVAHTAITSWLMSRLLSRKSKEEIQQFDAAPQRGFKLTIPGLGTVIDVYRTGKRIGFGVQVLTIEEGKRLLPQTRTWLRRIGCRCEPSVWQMEYREPSTTTKPSLQV